MSYNSNKFPAFKFWQTPGPHCSNGQGKNERHRTERPSSHYRMSVRVTALFCLVYSGSAASSWNFGLHRRENRADLPIYLPRRRRLRVREKKSRPNLSGAATGTSAEQIKSFADM